MVLQSKGGVWLRAKETEISTILWVIFFTFLFKGLDVRLVSLLLGNWSNYGQTSFLTPPLSETSQQHINLESPAGPAVFRSMQIFTMCHGICHLPWNLLPATEKCGTALFWLHLYLIQIFFALLFNFTIYKTIKSSHCKLTFMIIMSNMT